MFSRKIQNAHFHKKSAFALKLRVEFGSTIALLLTVYKHLKWFLKSLKVIDMRYCASAPKTLKIKIYPEIISPKIGIFGMISYVYRGTMYYVIKNILLILNKPAIAPIADKI